MTFGGFVKNNIVVEPVFAIQVNTSPANAILFVANKNSLISHILSLSSHFSRLNGVSPTSSYTKVRYV